MSGSVRGAPSNGCPYRDRQSRVGSRKAVKDKELIRKVVQDFHLMSGQEADQWRHQIFEKSTLDSGRWTQVECI